MSVRASLLSSGHLDVMFGTPKTVGTLLCHAYRAGKCTLGAILGTGTNGAYVERTSNITKLSASKEGLDSEMVINCEWGAFNNTVSALSVMPPI